MTTIPTMGSKLTAGVLVGALVVVGAGTYVAMTVLGSDAVSEGNAAADRLAADRSTDVARALTPPDTEKYSGKQLVAAALAAASSKTDLLPAAPSDGTGTVTAVAVAWNGSTAVTGGARVTVRIDAHVVAHSGGLLGLESTSDGKGQRCFVYALRDGAVSAVRVIRCPPASEAMKLPQPAALPRAST